jgi:hypothetical protein
MQTPIELHNQVGSKRAKWSQGSWKSFALERRERPARRGFFLGTYVALGISLAENASGTWPSSLGQEKQRAQGPFLFKLFQPLRSRFTVFSPRGSVFWRCVHRFVTELLLLKIGTEKTD